MLESHKLPFTLTVQVSLEWRRRILGLLTSIRSVQCESVVTIGRQNGILQIPYKSRTSHYTLLKKTFVFIYVYRDDFYIGSFKSVLLLMYECSPLHDPLQRPTPDEILSFTHSEHLSSVTRTHISISFSSSELGKSGPHP